MWKIKITYKDQSKITITGKHKDIPIELAIMYYNDCTARKCCKSVYQRYPKKNHAEISLIEKIEELRGERW